MPAQLTILPIVLPLVAAVINMLLHTPRNLQRGICVSALLLNLGACIWLLMTVYRGREMDGLVLVSQMGNWPAPFGISVVADPFSALLLCVTAVVALGVYIYVLSQTPLRFASGYFHALYPMLICGVNWCFLTGDLFNLFVAFEVMLLASYALMIVGTTPRQMRQAYKYVLLNLIISSVFVAVCGWVYGTLGTLNFAELALLAKAGAIEGRAALAVGVLLIVFGTKAAVFPLWFWLPDSYPTLPPALAGLYAGLLTKVGVYALVRLFVMCFHQAEAVADAVAPLLLLAAAATMFGGVLGAVASRTVRRILSIHVISQVGYMILGIGLSAGFLVSDEAATLAIAATLLYMVQHMIVKCSLFLCCGLIEQYAGTDDLDRFGAILRRDVPLAVIFLIAALSLVGLPPLSGFFGKFLLIRGSFERGDATGYVLGALAIMTAMLTLLSMAKIWSYGFWSDNPAGTIAARRDEAFRPRFRVPALLAVGGLVFVALTVGLLAHLYFNVAISAARIIINPEPYIEAVLGSRVLEELERATPLLAEAAPLADTEGGAK